MEEKPDTPVSNSEPAPSRPVRNLELKAALLLVFTGLLIVGSVLYLLYARGVFQATQTLVLVTEDSEGVVVGMDMTFAGFPIGRVRRVELAQTGNVRVIIDVAQKDAHWLRTSSVFTLVRGLVGGTNIRAYSGVLTDPPLPDGAERPALRGDATAELPRVLASAKEVLENVSAMTAEDAALRASLANLQEVTAKLKGPRGALGVMFGNDADAQKLVAALDRTNALLARVDALTAKADTQVFGPDGVMKEARATVSQLNGLLAETRTSLKKVDAVLVEAQGISANVKGATNDLGSLRADVEANLHKVEGLINELNRKWPFARETEVKLP
ncbi:MlaD family protein [Ramlibacter sp. WS9]|uniref:MlaD family protein n=1 Tax=Ramlibacter sp. WS9 TaxID=1882741 RepID=UPI001143A5E2|nr:MlaD family protein [Ramlibacter sp. WS9]ROZ79603.1 MCE family protein [Ramlibacter sp. WS9]